MNDTVQLTPFRGEVTSANEVIEAWRAARQRAKKLFALGFTIDGMLKFIAAALEIQRRPAYEPVEGIDRPAATAQLEDGSRVDWLVNWCFDDETVRHSRHRIDGRLDSGRRLPCVDLGRDDVGPDGASILDEDIASLVLIDAEEHSEAVEPSPGRIAA